MLLRNNGRRKDIEKICKVLRERERGETFGMKGEVEGRKERETGRRRGGRRKKFRVRTIQDDTGRWTTMRVAAGGRKKGGGHESTKAAGKVSARARARGIRVVEKGAKRLPDVPPEEEKRWKY